MTQQVPTIRAVVFDWAGTVIDFGSRAPIEAMLAAFETVGFAVSEKEARRPMGRAKRDHIAEMLFDDATSTRWSRQFGKPPGDEDIDRLYQTFLKTQADVIARYAELIDGVPKTVRFLDENNIRYGSSTGYTRDLMDVIAPLAADRGFRPAFIATADEPFEGRPAPWMIYRNCERMGVYPMSAVIKVDDTTVGIRAGRNAGCWTVGITASGNLMGLSKSQYDDLSDEERTRRLSNVENQLRGAGADDVITTVAELPDAIDRINRRIAEGQRPESE